MCHLGPYNLTLHRLRTTTGRRREEEEWMGSRGGNSSPLKETVRIQFVHPRDIGIERSFDILRPFLRFSSAPRKHIPHFPFLPSIHSRRPTSISVWERVSLHNSHSFPPLFPIQQASGAHSLIQCNTLQSTVAFLTPTLLDLSTTSYPISAPHCFFSRMNKYYSVFSDAILLSDDI